MESVVVNVSTKSESKLIKELASKMGYSSFLLSNIERKMIARIKLNSLNEKRTKMPDITMEEIQEEVRIVRDERYAKKAKKKGNR
jgi:hypothetical protein